MFTEADHPSVLSYWRSYGNEYILVVVNLSPVPQTTAIDLKKPGFHAALEDLFSGRRVHAEDGQIRMELHPFEFLWMTEPRPELAILSEDKLVLGLD